MWLVRPELFASADQEPSVAIASLCRDERLKRDDEQIRDVADCCIP